MEGLVKQSDQHCNDKQKVRNIKEQEMTQKYSCIIKPIIAIIEFPPIIPYSSAQLLITVEKERDKSMARIVLIRPGCSKMLKF